jgi:4-amino-4-deoxy-L-arabinose transferase-like glycosyltransferase
VVALLPAILGAAARDFWRPDEPDFAEHAKEMLQRGDLSVPYQNGQPFAEKPILLYWGVAASTTLTGGIVTPFASRLPSLFGGALLLLAAAGAAEVVGRRRDAPLAMAMLAATPLFFWQAQFLQMDALFSGLLAIALLVEVREMTSEDPSRRRALLGHVALGLAVLTKGPLALVVCALVPLVVTALLAAPWYSAVIAHLGWPYARELLLRQNVVRFLDPWDHVRPFWFYVADKVWTDFLPWTLPALLGIAAFHASGSLEKRPARSAVLTLLVVSLVFLSSSGSKQGKYLLFAYPFAAALASAAVGELVSAPDRSRRLDLAMLRTLRGTAGVALAGAVLLVPIVMRFQPGFVLLSPLVAVPVAAGALLALAALRRPRPRMELACHALAGGLWLAQGAVAACVFPVVDVAKTARPMYERLRPHVSHGEPLAYVSARFRCFPLLVLDRGVDHLRDAGAVLDWITIHPDGWLIAERQELDGWSATLGGALRVVDSQQEGGDTGLVLRAAAEGGPAVSAAATSPAPSSSRSRESTSPRS